MLNSVDYDEPSHLDLHCLHLSICFDLPGLKVNCLLSYAVAKLFLYEQKDGCTDDRDKINISHRWGVINPHSA